MSEAHFVALYYCSAKTPQEYAIWEAKVRAKWVRIQALTRKGKKK
jgi:hypothetical protein